MKSASESLKKSPQTLEEYQQLVDALNAQIRLLEEKVDLLVRRCFAPRSEKHSRNHHPTLFDDLPVDAVEEETETLPATSPRKKKKKGGRRTPPDDLPRIRIEHDVDEEAKRCSCGETMHRMKEIVSEQFDIVPAHFRVLQHVRFQYGCRCGAKPMTTPLTPSILPRHQVSPSLLASVIVQKFEDALPLHRQAKIYTHRFGVPFNDTTLSGWVIKSAQTLTPLVEHLRVKLLENRYLQADETTLQVLKEPYRDATKKSWLWLGTGGGSSPGGVAALCGQPKRPDSPDTLQRV
jgi:transposase